MEDGGGRVSCGRLLRENAELIKEIVRLQNSGQILESMTLQARLHCNLSHLAADADGRSHPWEDGGGQRDGDNGMEVTMSRFVLAVKTHGLADPAHLSRLCEIPTDQVVELGRAYIAFLHRQRRTAEAKNLENELAVYDDGGAQLDDGG